MAVGFAEPALQDRQLFTLSPSVDSDGAGRSGTYVLIDMVLNKMAKGERRDGVAIATQGSTIHRRPWKKLAHCCPFPETSLVEAVCSKREICEVPPLFFVELAHIVGLQ